MLDLAWTEIALIAVVAVVVIGPKDLPEAIRGVAKGVQKLRRMVGEFQQQADELVREAKLDDVRNQIADVRNTISDIRSFDIKGQIEKAVDGDGSVRKAFTEDPLRDTFMPPSTEAGSALPEPEPEPERAPAPAFVPPQVARDAAPAPRVDAGQPSSYQPPPAYEPPPSFSPPPAYEPPAPVALPEPPAAAPEDAARPVAGPAGPERPHTTPSV